MNVEDIIIKIYNSTELANLLSKIHPESIRDDLRQEIAVTMLTIGNEKIIALNERNELIRYVLKVCWILAVSNRYILSNSYRKKELVESLHYLHSQMALPEIPISLAINAKNYINKKNRNIFEDHEARIFNRYVELGSARAVAKYYGIPLNHTTNVINKVKKELKCFLSQ